MRAIHLLTLLSAISALVTVGACGSSSNGSNNQPQGTGDGGGNEGGSSSGGSSGGSTDSGGNQESGATDGPFVRADHLPFPQLTYQGGPIMTATKVVSVTFPGDTNASTFDQFGQNL